MSDPGADPGTYRLRDDVGLPLIRQRLRSRLVPIALVTIVAAIVVPLLQQDRAQGLPALLVTTGLTFVLAAGVMYVVYRRALAREVGMWRSYRLALSPEGVRREIAGFAPVEVRRAEVTRLVAVPGQGLSVHGADPSRCVFIPAQLERFDEVAATLGQWAPVTPPDPARSRLARWLSGLVWLGIVGAWLATSWARDPRAIVASAGLLYAGLAYIGWATGRNPYITSRQKGSVFLMLVLLALGPFARWALDRMGSSP